jgi:protein-disulfide isomerase
MKTLLAILLLAAAIPATAQTSVPAGQADHFRDTSMLKPPTGAKVAIVEFEDLECPSCGHAFPIVRAAIDHYKIPFLRYDYPFLEIGHVWSFGAAVTARYLQDKVSPRIAEDYRRDVFAHQNTISSKDDLVHYTLAWFKSHGQNMPFVIDPTGLFTREVNSDRALGQRMGLRQTPSLFVVTQHSWVQVLDDAQFDSTIDDALAQTSAPATTSTHRSSKK